MQIVQTTILFIIFSRTISSTLLFISTIKTLFKQKRQIKGNTCEKDDMILKHVWLCSVLRQNMLSSYQYIRERRKIEYECLFSDRSFPLHVHILRFDHSVNFYQKEET